VLRTLRGSQGERSINPAKWQQTLIFIQLPRLFARRSLVKHVKKIESEIASLEKRKFQASVELKKFRKAVVSENEKRASTAHLVNNNKNVAKSNIMWAGGWLDNSNVIGASFNPQFQPTLSQMMVKGGNEMVNGGNDAPSTVLALANDAHSDSDCTSDDENLLRPTQLPEIDVNAAVGNMLQQAKKSARLRIAAGEITVGNNSGAWASAALGGAVKDDESASDSASASASVSNENDLLNDILEHFDDPIAATSPLQHPFSPQNRLTQPSLNETAAEIIDSLSEDKISLIEKACPRWRDNVNYIFSRHVEDESEIDDALNQLNQKIESNEADLAWLHLMGTCVKKKKKLSLMQ